MLIWLDIIIAAVVIIYFQFAPGVSAFDRKLFWWGCLLGALWEFPIFLMGPEFLANPLYRVFGTFPIHPISQFISHSIWDGGLFMIGIRIARWAAPAPHFQKFSFRELLPYIIWGVSSAVVIEIIGSYGIWEYIPNRWNVEWFKVNDRSITSLPIMIWAVAPVVHYLLALRIHRRSQESAQP